MTESAAPSPERKPLFAENRRRHPRLVQECLQSSLGPVVNLSLGGARLICRQPPTEEQIDLHIDDGLGEAPLAVRARVLRSERVGWRRHTVAVEFLDLDEESTQRLVSMSASGRFFLPEV